MLSIIIWPTFNSALSLSSRSNYCGNHFSASSNEVKTACSCGQPSPCIPHNHNVKHAMVSDPGEVNIFLPLASMFILASTSWTVSSFPSWPFRGPIPSTFRLTVCLLAVLSIKPDVTIRPSRTCYPVVGHLPGRESHPLDYTTLPGRNSAFVICCPIPFRYYFLLLIHVK